MPRSEELTVIVKTYDLILWSCHHISRFPRNHRFVLGERMERSLYDLLETLLQAKYSRSRQHLLDSANLKLEILRFLKEGIRFLGYRVFPTHCLVVKDNVRRFRRRARKLQCQYAAGEIDGPYIRQRLMSWAGHARQANSYVLTERLFATISFQRARTDKPCVAWRRLQQ